VTDRKEHVKTRFGERVREWAANYSDIEPRALGPQNLLSRHRFALEMVESAVPRGSRILDVGCGTGEMVAKLTERGYEAWGVDLAEPMIAFASERYGSSRFRVGDIEKIPFDDSTFDAVVCLGVVEYLVDDEQALKEIRRVLKPGGSAIVSTPSAISPLHHMDRMVGALVEAVRPLYRFVKYRLRGRQLPVARFDAPVNGRRYYRGRWLRSLRSAGFEAQECIGHGWGWYRSELGLVVESVSRGASRCRSSLERMIGPGSLVRAKRRLVRSRVVNWLAWEHIVRMSAVKSSVLAVSADVLGIIKLVLAF
jgi:ubiquinone/menaquinone biosynthesis C-methylase UbiE